MSSLCRSSAAPAGCVWASREEQLQAAYTLPGAFKVVQEKAAADQIAVTARIDEISAFRIVIFCFSGYNSLIKMNSGSMNHRSPPEKECVL